MSTSPGMPQFPKYLFFLQLFQTSNRIYYSPFFLCNVGGTAGLRKVRQEKLDGNEACQVVIDGRGGVRENEPPS
jgi:hypothetical protein